MKKLIVLATLILSATASADMIKCVSRTGDAVNEDSIKTETQAVSTNTVLKYEQGVLKATVQFKSNRIIQMMIENTQNYTFTQLSQKALSDNEGEIFLQDIKNDGQFIELSCSVIKD